MNREQLLQEIARLDEEINRVVGSTRLPALEYRPFPIGTWITAAMFFAWWKFGDRLPGAYVYHYQSQNYAFYLGLIFIVIAIFSSISWFIRSRKYGKTSEEYTAASRDARELQERRRELQAELRALSKE
jgi:MFS superfamily sulfate permease-like transporter